MWLRSYSRFLWIPLNFWVSAFYWAQHKGKKPQTGKKKFPLCWQASAANRSLPFLAPLSSREWLLHFQPPWHSRPRSCYRQHLFPVIPSRNLIFSCLECYSMVKGDSCFPFRRWLHLCYCRKDLYFLQIPEKCFVVRWQVVHLLSHICLSTRSLHTSLSLHTVGHFPVLGSVKP